MKKIIFIALLGALILNGCKKKEDDPEPFITTADFVYGGNTTVPANIVFINTSKNADEYNWFFGDGTNFNSSLFDQEPPPHNYNVAGAYNVTLVARSSFSYNTPDTVTKVILIH